MAVEWDDSIIREFYAALSGKRSWPGALSQLARAFNAPICQIATYDKISGQLIEDPNDVLTRRDPRWPVMDFHAAEAWSASPEAPQAEGIKSARIPPMLCARLAESARQATFAWIVRRPGAAPFKGDEIVTALRYMKVLSDVFRLARRLSRLESTSTIGYRMLQSAECPTYLIDRAGRIHAQSASARDSAQANRFFITSDALLRGRSEDGDHALQTGIAALCARAARSQGSVPLRQAVRMVDAEGGSLLCSLWHLSPPPGDQELARGWPDRLLLSISPEPRSADSADDARYLAQLFDLSPVEGQIATAVAAGVDAADLAESRQVAIATIRSQMSGLLQKTQSRRQVEVVAKVLRALRR